MKNELGECKYFIAKPNNKQTLCKEFGNWFIIKSENIVSSFADKYPGIFYSFLYRIHISNDDRIHKLLPLKKLQCCHKHMHGEKHSNVNRKCDGLVQERRSLTPVH